MGSWQISSTSLFSSSCSSLCFPFAFGEGIGMGCVKVPLLGFLTVLGLAGLDWEEEFNDDEFFFWMQGERRRGGREM